MQASTLTTYFRVEGNQIGRAMQGKARQGRRQRFMGGDCEIEVVRGPWEGRARYPGSCEEGTGIWWHEGTKVRGHRCEGAKRNGAMNRGYGKRAAGACCARWCAARIGTVQGWPGPLLSPSLPPLSPSLVSLLSGLPVLLQHFASSFALSSGTGDAVVCLLAGVTPGRTCFRSPRSGEYGSDLDCFGRRFK